MSFLQVRSRSACVVISAALACCNFSSHAEVVQDVMPLPAQVTPGTGDLVLDGGLDVVLQGFTEPRLERARDRFFTQLSRETGILGWPAARANRVRFAIVTTGPSKPVQELGEDESYRLEIRPDQVVLSAPTPLGVLHGLQTFLQLVHTTKAGWIVAAMTIEDKPRFPWRGLMIDSGRHFMPVAVLKQNLDLMEAVKLNVFHWHLSEDQGFRVESKRFPLLQEKGSDGLFYTQDEIRGLIDYARDRGIRVIPEFDMPGHAGSWFVGYPELASGQGPYGIARKFGIFDPAMDPTRESTYTFLDGFFAEMTALFPDRYFHMGGDECNGKEWDSNPRIRQYMQAHGMRDDAALQAYFTGRVQKLVTAHNKIPIGWDEVLQPDTPKNVVIQSWRGQDSLADAARQGNRGILSWGYYLDLNEPAAQHYAVDPFGKSAAKLDAEQQSRILGGEAAMWTEYISPENISSRIWPRAAAVAERLWSPKEATDAAMLYPRLDHLSKEMMLLQRWPGSMDPVLLQRIVGSADAAPLKVLADVVEPPKEYAREELRQYYTSTPLNRLVDVVPAESEQARVFLTLSKLIASGRATAADMEQARHDLDLWRDNDASLQPLLPQSALSAELVPVSQGLKETAVIGLRALAAVRSKAPVSGQTREEDLAALKKLAAPQAVLLNMIVPGVEALVEAERSR